MKASPLAQGGTSGGSNQLTSPNPLLRRLRQGGGVYEVRSMYRQLRRYQPGSRSFQHPESSLKERIQRGNWGRHLKQISFSEALPKTLRLGKENQVDVVTFWNLQFFFQQTHRS